MTTIQCEHCGTEVVALYHGHVRRFCSIACSNRSRPRKPPHTVRSTCEWCGNLFWQSEHFNRDQQFCGRTCQLAGMRARRTREQPPAGMVTSRDDDPQPSPLEWDGVSRYSDHVQGHDYTLACLMCGSGEDTRLTPAAASAMRARRCPRCAGRMFLSRADFGTLGVTDPRIPIRTSTVARRRSVPVYPV